MPNLGTADTPMKKVFKFYEFWEKFDTWRDFVHEEEYILAEAENRHEKRWMEKENRKLKKILYKKERIRLNRLVNLSQNFDPRIINMRKKEEEEKLKRKEEVRKRKLEKRMKGEQEKQRIKDEKEKKMKDLEMAKLKASEQRKMKKLETAETAAKFKEVFLFKIQEKSMDKFFADEVIRKLKTEELKILIEDLVNDNIVSGKEFKTKLKELAKQRTMKADNLKKEKKKMMKKEKAKTEEDWSEEETRMLQKGVIKFPPGTHRRWHRITQFVGGKFKEEEVIRFAKKLNSLTTKKTKTSKVQIYKVNEKKTVSKNIVINGK